MSATDPVQAALMAVATAHRPTSGMQVSSGVTCVCGYWTGSEPQGPIPGGWNQLLPHMMREAAAAARPAIEREAKAAALVRVRRYAEGHAITAKANGRDDRAWLDLLIILDQIEEGN